MDIIRQITIIFFFTFLGDGIQKLTNLAMPGSIIGLLLLFLSLKTKLIKLEDIQKTGSFLQKNMAILFVPVSVGLLNYLDVLKMHGLPLLIIIFISTAITYVLTAKFSEYSITKELGKDD